MAYTYKPYQFEEKPGEGQGQRAQYRSYASVTATDITPKKRNPIGTFLFWFLLTLFALALLSLLFLLIMPPLP